MTYKNNKKKHHSRTRFHDTIKKRAILIAKLRTAAYKSKLIKFKLDENPLQYRVYFIYFINSLKKN